MQKSLFSLFSLLLLVGCTSLRPPRIEPYAIYTVKQGDTLSSVAVRYGVSVQSLLTENQLSNVARIYPGERLRLPKGYLTGRKIRSSQVASRDILREAYQYVGNIRWPIQRSQDNPRQGTINSPFGKRWSSFHEGIDIAGKVGISVYAAHRGKVIYNGHRMNGYGNMVVIKGNGLMTAYAHNRKNLVRVGDLVEKGEQIAELGMSGRVTGPHLHFETRIKNARGRYVAVNPLLFFE